MTTVVSATAFAGACFVATAARACETVVSGACLVDGCAATGDVEEAVFAIAEVESAARFGAGGLEGGNKSCETAIAMSDRKRARKKRLSIQGTGS